jgi:prepilin signal peptidase PulO-like enzyme (type II secretory pathway)
MTLLIAAVTGLVLGHIIRRLTPYIIGWKDKSLPFALPWPEVIAMALFLLTAQRFGVGLDQWKWYLLILLLLSVTTTDQLSKYIRAELCYAGAVVGILLSAIYPGEILTMFDQSQLLGLFGVEAHHTHVAGLTLGFTGAVMGWFQMEFIRRIFKPLVNMDAMGSGDALLMLMAGAFIGPKAVLYALIPACIAGVVIGSIWKIVKGSAHFPFGPSLSLGVMLMLLYGETLTGAIFGFHNLLYQMPAEGLLFVSLGLIVLLVFLVLRLKRKAAEYERMIEEDYQEIDEKIQS